MPLSRLLRCMMALGLACAAYFAPMRTAQADYCTSSNHATTFTYTAATIAQAQTITINDSWSCNSGNIFYPNYSDWVCLYMDAYTGQSSAIAYNGTDYTLGYSLFSTAGTGAASPNPAPASVAAGAGSWYGTGGTTTVGTSGTSSGPLLSSIRITIPAGAARTVPPGVYTVTVRFTLDMQGGSTSTSLCNKAGQGGPNGNGQDWGTTTYTFTVVVPKVCSINAVDTINFGNIAAVNTLAADVRAQGNVYFTCSLSTPYTLYLGDGLNRDAAGSGNRNMLGSDGSSRIPYQLYTTAATTTIWDSVNGMSGTGSATQTFNTVYGKIAAGSALPSALGTYQDRVIVTVSY